MTRTELQNAIIEAEAAGDTDGADALRKMLLNADDRVRSDAIIELHPEQFPTGTRRHPVKHQRVTMGGKKVWISEYLD